MRMRPPTAIALLATVLTLTACASGVDDVPPTASGSVASSVTSTAPLSASSTPEQGPAALVVTKETLEIRGSDGSVLTSALLDEGQDVLGVLTDLLGEVPVATPVPAYPIVNYDWDAVKLVLTSDTYATVSFTAAEVAGLRLETGDGIHVGMTWDEARAHGAEESADLDGDGRGDYLMLEPTENPDAPSLENPGQPGLDFIALFLAAPGTTVTMISSPANDYSDL